MNQETPPCPTQSSGEHLPLTKAEKCRRLAYRNQPWRHSTGPRTPAGKAKVAKNGLSHQDGVSQRWLIRQLKGPNQAFRALADLRGQLLREVAASVPPGTPPSR